VKKNALASETASAFWSLISDAKMAEAWHKAGVANGGTSMRIRPGPNGAYLAYLRDPDGNKVVAVAR
jgi:hypothetical protein